MDENAMNENTMKTCKKHTESDMLKKMDLGAFILALAIPLLTGMLSAALSSQGMVEYGSMRKPLLSPPAWVFSVAWTILYLMMGLASYFIFITETDVYEKTKAMRLYAIQLIMNFFWSIIFFNLHMYLIAFIWLFVMWCIVIWCTLCYFRINKRAAVLMIPYILWLTFAAYLNLGSYVLSMARVP